MAIGTWRTARKFRGANGQGRTKDEAKESLADAIALILEDRRADGLRGVPADALRETVVVKVRKAWAQFVDRVVAEVRVRLGVDARPLLR